MRRLTALLAALLLPTMAQAAVIPPEGVDADFEAFSGIEARKAVILCEELTVRAAPSASSEVLTTLRGDSEKRYFLTWEQQGNWINAYYSDGAAAGWVRAEYVIIDPPYFETEQETPVLAYGEADAPRVALLPTGERLPVLLETEGYYVVALHGGAGWIAK